MEVEDAMTKLYFRHFADDEDGKMGCFESEEMEIPIMKNAAKCRKDLVRWRSTELGVRSRCMRRRRHFVHQVLQWPRSLLSRSVLFRQIPPMTAFSPAHISCLRERSYMSKRTAPRNRMILTIFFSSRRWRLRSICICNMRERSRKVILCMESPGFTAILVRNPHIGRLSLYD